MSRGLRIGYPRAVRMAADSAAVVVSGIGAALATGGAAAYLSQQAAGMAVGEWRAISMDGLTTANFRFDGNHMLGYCDKGCYDPIVPGVRFIAKAASELAGATRDFRIPDSTNAVAIATSPPWEGAGLVGHGYQHNTIDPATGDYYYRIASGAGIIWRHRKATDDWVQLSVGVTANTGIAGAIEWLPTIGDEGGLVMVSDKVCQRWDKETDTWSTVSTALDQGLHATCVRNVPQDLVYLGGGNEGPRVLYTLTATGSLVARTGPPVNFGVNTSVTTACPVSGDLLLIYGDSVGYKYTLGTDTWSSLSGVPSFGAAGNADYMVAIPIEAYGVIMLVSGHTRSTYLYKHAA